MSCIILDKMESDEFYNINKKFFHSFVNCQILEFDFNYKNGKSLKIMNSTSDDDDNPNFLKWECMCVYYYFL